MENVHATLNDLDNTYRGDRIDRWLSAPDASSDFDRARRQRHGDSGHWFLESESFKTWKKQRNSFLWLHRIPGYGKTVFSSTVIEELKRHEAPVVLYFYFRFDDIHKQTLEYAVRALLQQFRARLSGNWKRLDLLFSSCAEGRQQPTIESLCTVLREKFQQTEEVWIVLDALDECDEKEGPPNQALLSWIESLVQAEESNVHMLVTSRPEHYIDSKIREFANDQYIIQLQSDLVNDDIRACVRDRVKEGTGFKRWRQRPEVQDDIESKLTEKAKGMSELSGFNVQMYKQLIWLRFRWVTCQLDALEKCLDPTQLQRSLSSLPPTLDETYARILRQIPPEHKRNAIRILQLLAFSKRPLRIEEVVDAIAIDPEGSPHFDPKNRMPDKGEISCYCSSLVTIVCKEIRKESHEWIGEESDGESDGELENKKIMELHLAHFSVKEYLLSDRIEEHFISFFEDSVAKRSIAELCVSYLIQFGELRLPQ